MKVCREFDDVTSAGKLFHVRAAATGNARSPTVASRVSGTANAEVDDDRKRCRPGIPETGCRAFDGNNHVSVRSDGLTAAGANQETMLSLLDLSAAFDYRPSVTATLTTSTWLRS